MIRLVKPRDLYWLHKTEYDPTYLLLYSEVLGFPIAILITIFRNCNKHKLLLKMYIDSLEIKTSFFHSKIYCLLL